MSLLEGVHTPVQVASRHWKRQEMDSPLEFLEGMHPTNRLILAPKTYFQTSDLQNCKLINCVFLSH